ncbi:hypothetical protein DXG01_017009 [Tephrocybe rancida]|nr:hypothetical protein DXG01_017009 [Tephrocybe rancida]
MTLQVTYIPRLLSVNLQLVSKLPFVLNYPAGAGHLRSTMLGSTMRSIFLAVTLLSTAHVLALPVQAVYEAPTKSVNTAVFEAVPGGGRNIATGQHSAGVAHRSVDVQNLEERGVFATIPDLAGGIGHRSVDGQNIEERNIIGAIVDIGKGIGELISKIIEKVKAKRRLNKARTAFAKSVVDLTRQEHPQFNVVVIDTKHRADFKGTEGKDWGHNSKELQSEGKTIKYDVYFGGEGEFWNQGNKGSSDWAYGGSYDVDKKSKGKHIIFKHP